MKNRNLILFILIFSVVSTVNAHPILITEILPNPSGIEPNGEWIEIHNPTGTAYCVDGWEVGDGTGEGTWTIPDPSGDDDYILYPGGYITFANNADSFLVKYSYNPDLAKIPGSTSAIQLNLNGTLYLANTSDQVYLRDKTDSIIDCLQWGSIYETGADSIWYPLGSAALSDDPFIRNPQDIEGTEDFGEVSEQLAESWTTTSAISETFEGPGTGGFNPSGLSGIILSDLIHIPTSPSPTEDVQIKCKMLSDTIIDFTYMIYTISDFSNPDTSIMIQLNDSIYIDTISAYPIGTIVKYYVSAANIDGDSMKIPLSAPSSYREYIVSEGSDFYEAHFNKTVDNSVGIINFADGEDSLDFHIAKHIGQANKTIDICLYDLDRQVIADSLISAYNRGINVRFITDADNRAIAQVVELEAAGITVIDDAFPVGYGGSNIMHNKFTIIDTQTIISGSYNVTDNGTDRNANNQVMIKDILIAENFTKEFTEMWGSETMVPDANNSKFAGSKTDNMNHVFYINDDTIKVYMSPSDGCAAKIINAIETADTSIYFCYYVFSSQSIADAMKDRYDNNGVDVRGVFDVTFWNQDYSKSLDLRGDWNSTNSNNPWSPPADVFVDNVDGNLLHHKYMLIDPDNWMSNPIVITGSYNLSASAETGNDENILIIHSRYFAELFLQEFAARYHEAGGTESFSINTNINAINISVKRNNENVIINYDLSMNGFTGIKVSFNDNIIAYEHNDEGQIIHKNPKRSVYTISAITLSGNERIIGSFAVNEFSNVLSVISENRIFSDIKIYRAKIKSNEEINIEVYNIAGERIYHKIAKGPEIIFEMKKDIPAGIYYVKFISSGQELIDKLIKVR